MAVSSGQARESPQRLNPSASAISPGAVLTRQRPRQRAVPSSAFAPCGSETRGVTRGRAQPLPVQRPCATARVLVRCASWRPQAGKARPPRKGPSAPGPREALRDQIVAGVHAVHRDRGKRPPIGVGAKPRNRHPPARQQPRKGNPRGFARGKVATQAYDRRRSWHLGLSGNSGASILAMRTRSRPPRIVSPSWTEGARQRAAAARTIGMGWSLAPSPARANQPCRLPHWPRSSPAGPASMPASLGGRRCESADDPP